MAGGSAAGSVEEEIRGGAGGVIGGLVFAALATGGIAAVGWLAVRGFVPAFDGAGFVGTLSGRGAAALGVWMAAAALVPLVLPVATLVG